MFPFIHIVHATLSLPVDGSTYIGNAHTIAASVNLILIKSE